jgi:hypothetical protein
VGKPEGKKALEYLGVNGRIMLKLIFLKVGGGLYWIGLAQDRPKWWALVKGEGGGTRLPKKYNEFLDCSRNN